MQMFPYIWHDTSVCHNREGAERSAKDVAEQILGGRLILGALTVQHVCGLQTHGFHDVAAGRLLYDWLMIGGEIPKS